ncbi:IclR family transcriptional regulator [Aeromicrobium sp. UC242_57]|uniref:IclR family transcriptional regulator n=1 Tax=Aeromicrobium sp. UC242_57 TaxID=3374624 RepID=UPI0037B9A389
MEQERRSNVQSVSRSNAVLGTLASRSPMTAREIGEAVGLDRTVVYRLLRTLESDDLVEVRGTDWRLGSGTLKIGMSYLDGLPFASVAPAYAIDLHRRAVADRPWLVSLGVPAGDRVVLIDRFWGQNSPLNSILPIGTRFEMGESATGIALLAAMPPADAKAAMGTERIAALQTKLDEACGNGGLAFAHDSLRAGLSAIAAPVLDRQGHVVGAINVSGIHMDDHLTVTSELAQHVRRSAHSITAALR